MSDPRSSLTLNDDDQYDWDGSRDRIVNLRAMGQSITYISKAVGLSAAIVSRILKSEFGERNSSRQDCIDEQKATLNWMKKKITERIDKAGEFWDRRDAELLLKFEERVSKLKGLDTPQQHEVTVAYEEQSEEELLQALQAAGYALQLPTSPKALPQSHLVEDAEFTTVTNVEDGRTEVFTGEGPEGK